jgi:hypothetical protein
MTVRAAVRLRVSWTMTEKVLANEDLSGRTIANESLSTLGQVVPAEITQRVGVSGAVNILRPRSWRREQ